MQKGEKMTNTKTLALILIIVLVSFLGFVVENIFTSFSHGFIDNRNMVLPFLLGYGLAVFTIYKLFGTPHTPLFFGKPVVINSSFISTLYYFAIAFLCVSLGEIILGHLIEWSCDIVWWNYTALPLHITKYTSIPTSTIFATLITVFMKHFFNPILNNFSKMNHQTLSILAISLIVLLSLDFINSGIYMFKNHHTLRLWSIEFDKSIKQILIEMKGNH
jgi:uncharacterized membrane protein